MWPESKLAGTNRPRAARIAEADRDQRGALQWRLNRLRCMTPREVSHRIVRALAIRGERAGLRPAAPVPRVVATAAPPVWIHPAARVDAASYLAAADRIVAGRLDLFALRDIDVGSPPRWNRDPKSGKDAPLTFGKLLDYRNPALVGDIKYLWELNRHLHLVTLAQAYALSGDTRYSDALRIHLASWFDACPLHLGPNWTSALELGIRLINWSVAWQLLGGAASPLFEDAQGVLFAARWRDSVFRHAEFICGHFSRYSSANNHLIGEAAGLHVAALTWPCWPQALRWLEEGTAILEREVLSQNAPDGVNREQAISYQQFDLDLFLLPLLADRANGRRFSPRFEARIVAMLEFVASIMDIGGQVPAFGDSDDALVTRLAVNEDFCNYRSLLATGALLFQREDFKAKAGALDDKNRWLFGRDADASYARLPANTRPLPIRRSFPWGGYHILGDEFETAREIRMVVDAGPLGYEAIAAHGHADALSFTLAVGGREFLVDPGTYAYHAGGPWRDYFRGTAAHNTVRVDGVDQSQPGGSFMWLRKARARGSLSTGSKARDYLDAWHDGYVSLRDPVVHRRSITYIRRDRRFTIADRLTMAAAHDVEIFFHCSERCTVERAGDDYLLLQEGHALRLSLPKAEGASAGVLLGSTAPIGGWRSRRFDHKVPAPTIVWRARIEGSCLLTTRIEC